MLINKFYSGLNAVEFLCTSTSHSFLMNQHVVMMARWMGTLRTKAFVGEFCHIDPLSVAIIPHKKSHAGFVRAAEMSRDIISSILQDNDVEFTVRCSSRSTSICSNHSTARNSREFPRDLISLICVFEWRGNFH